MGEKGKLQGMDKDHFTNIDNSGSPTCYETRNSQIEYWFQTYRYPDIGQLCNQKTMELGFF